MGPGPPAGGRAARGAGAGRAAAAALTLGALGVVFGDIGTSPLYALQTVFSAHDHAVKPDEAGVYGVISLVFWAITIIVSVKYVTFIMRADNDGEGGIMALIARVGDLPLQGRAAKATLVALGHLRRGAVLRRRHDHAGDLRAVGGRGARGGGAGAGVARHPDHARRARRCCSRSSASARSAVGRLFGPVMAVWFVDPRARRPGAGDREPRDPQGAVADVRGRVLPRPRLGGVPRARLRRARGHGRRGAVRRHGPLRPPADPPRVVLASSSRR